MTIASERIVREWEQRQEKRSMTDLEYVADAVQKALWMAHDKAGRHSPITDALELLNEELEEAVRQRNALRDAPEV